MKVDVYNQDGKKVDSLELPKFFELPWNADLVHQVVTSEQANRRQVLAHAKTRDEVRGGGRKPWRQKGTGRARHGSIRSPLWRHGGKAHGPTKERNFKKKIPKKMRRKALLTVLAQKARANEILWLESIKVKEPKTKETSAIMRNLQKIKGFDNIAKKGKRALILEPTKDTFLERAFQNIPYVDTMEARNANPLDLLQYAFLIVPADSLGVIEKTFIKTSL